MKVAVVIPVKNGAAMLPDCVAAVQAQSRPVDETIVVVAPSSDQTQEVALRLSGPGMRVLDNPSHDRGSAINRALDNTDADVLVMIDVQARVAPDYVETALRSLADRNAAVVGGPMRPVGGAPIGEAMAACLRSPFAIGTSQFHFEGSAREVDSVYLGVYRAEVFRRIGRYNSALPRTEDDDLNARVREHGFRIWLDPLIRSDYLCRNDLPSIWRQYFGYGYWKVALLAVRPAALRPRHLAPAAFVLTAAVTALVSLMTGWPVLVLLAGAWLLAAVISALAVPAASTRGRLLFPFVALTIHFAYGVGTLLGMVGFPGHRGRIRAAAVEAERSG